MAKAVAKPMGKRRGVAAAPGVPEPVTLKVVVDSSIDTPAYYVNHAEIAVGAHDMTLIFARLPAKPSRAELEEASESGELVVEPEIQVVFPPTLLPGLIKALEMSQEGYESLHGGIRKPKDE